jgi:two-component system NarL family sensor kinase
VTDLGRRLAAVTVPGDVLPAVVTAVAESLRLPYVAIERPGDSSVLAAHGGKSERVERWPLTYRGATVGALVAAPRAGETSFGERDRAVLADLAHQAGPAVHAEALTADLLDSRQRLVSAREEERRRLRRDLHDGLGPLLTAIGLNLDAARARGPHPVAAEKLLRQAKEASAQAIGDLRVIVHGLRPQALDDLGLIGAVTTHTRRLAETTPLRISVDADDVPELPAAVEVAAFRVTVEAVTNVVRHAAASRCRVRLGLAGPDEFVVSVSDDGGASRPWSPGVGLLAMRERVA